MPGFSTSSFADGKIEIGFLEQSVEAPGLANAARDTQIAAVAEHMSSFIAGAKLAGFCDL